MVRLVRPGWWLGLMVVISCPVAAQQTADPVSRPQLVELREHYPNPSLPAAAFPFTISPEVCRSGYQPTVSFRIFNVVAQQVAILALGDPPYDRLDRLRMRCGEHHAVWDGRIGDGLTIAPPGIYYYQLTVDGLRYTKKMIVPQPAKPSK